MSMDEQTVRKVASLARLKVTDEEVSVRATQLSNILGFVEQLGEVNTDNVEPLPSPVDIKLRLREDKVSDGDCVQDVLANAPEEMEDFYVVPKVVE